MSKEYHHGVGELKASTHIEHIGGSTPSDTIHVPSQGKNIAGTTKVAAQHVVQHAAPASGPPVTVFVVVIVNKRKNKTIVENEQFIVCIFGQIPKN
jgi:hypothetical protein